MTAALGTPARATAPATRSWLTIALGVVLVVDGIVTLLLEVLYLPLYLGHATVPEAQPIMAAAQPLAATLTTGAIPFPITALIAAVLNVLLVKGMSTVTDRIGIMALPLTAWVVTYMLCMLGGPGGDVWFMNDWPTLALLVGGLLPAGLYLYYRANLRVVAARPVA
ncbi:hypothetical protein [Nocardia sp. NPDC050406]|uniref:hypothetical protein n=1 Tax=Nocardia sp. NPDC050406 TaxID=3364318 RepID=UPI0037B68045